MLLVISDNLRFGGSQTQNYKAHIPPNLTYVFTICLSYLTNLYNIRTAWCISSDVSETYKREKRERRIAGPCTIRPPQDQHCLPIAGASRQLRPLCHLGSGSVEHGERRCCSVYYLALKQSGLAFHEVHSPPSSSLSSSSMSPAGHTSPGLVTLLGLVITAGLLPSQSCHLAEV